MTRKASTKKSPKKQLAKVVKPKAKGDKKTSPKKRVKKSSTLILKNTDEQFIIKTKMTDYFNMVEGYIQNYHAEVAEEKKLGRPSTISPAVVTKLYHSFAMGSKVYEACFFAGISTRAFYRFSKGNEDFRHIKEVLMKMPSMIARQRLVAGLDESFENALKYLAVKEKDEFSTRVENLNTNINTDTAMVDERTATLVKTTLGNFGKKLAEMSSKNQAKADKKR